MGQGPLCAWLAACGAATRRSGGHGSKDPVSDGESEGTGTVGASLNLAKNLVGSGMLSLPSGVAAFSANPAALGPSLVFLALAAFLSAQTFCLIGRACEETGTSTFGSAWDKSLRRGAWVPQLVCILECLGGSVVYAMVLGDVFSSLLQGMGVLPPVLTGRSSIIGLISAMVLFPLCCLRSLAQLAKFSLLGTMASSFVVFVVVKRFLDGSYGPLGAFHDAGAGAVLDAGPWGASPRMLILISILSTAYLMHFNAPQFYAELRPSGTPAGEAERAAKRRRLGRVALVGFGIAAVQYALTMVFGFLTFGRATKGNVLMNYAAADPLAVAARAAIGISMLFGYPMQFAGFRDGILEVCGVRQVPRLKHRLVTAGLLAVAAGVACLFSDLGHFQAIEGALLASFLLYIAPPLMALRFERRRGARARLVSIIALGIAMGVIGCVVTMT